jgi:catechol 2,3-dioxygenase-like lactoylglutathione lyase family enzyme
MLSSSPVAAVVAVSDMDGAKEFYGGTLGLQPSPDITDPGGVLYACGGGTHLLVYESGYAGHNQATAAAWQVDDLDGEMVELRARGVTFEQYDIPGIERDGDVHTMGDLRSAWFKDPEGNILNISSRG